MGTRKRHGWQVVNETLSSLSPNGCHDNKAR
jgi:hypothetical protein